MRLVPKFQITRALPCLPCFSCRHPTLSITAAGLLVVGIAALPGCGGGGERAASVVTAPTAPVAQGVGRATFTVHWPAPSRLIPSAANSLVVTLTKSDGTALAEQRMARPAGGRTTTAAFAELPVGDVIAKVSAYPNADGTGVAQASASASVTIEGGKTATLALTLDSTVDHLNVSPSPLALTVGQTATLVVTAKNLAGEIVLTDPAKITFETRDSSIAGAPPATVDSAGIVRALVPGTINCVVTETESGKTGTVPVTVTAASTPSPTPTPTPSPRYVPPPATYVGTGNLIVNMDIPGRDTYVMVEYDRQGRQVPHVPADFKPGVYKGLHPPGNLVIGPTGDQHIVGGSHPTALSTWERQTGMWKMRTFPGWSFGSSSIAVYGKYVFSVDGETAYDGAPNGLVRFDLSAEQAERFADGTDYHRLTLGQDRKLYAVCDQKFPLRGSEIRVFDPVTLQYLRTLYFVDTVGPIAVNAQGEIFTFEAADELSVCRYNPAGTRIARTRILGVSANDMDLSQNGTLALSGKFGEIVLLDSSLQILRTIQTNHWYLYVTWDEASF